MTFVVDLANQKFFKLTFIKNIGIKNGNTMWEALCECGNLCEVIPNRVFIGHKKVVVA